MSPTQRHPPDLVSVLDLLHSAVGAARRFTARLFSPKAAAKPSTPPASEASFRRRSIDRGKRANPEQHDGMKGLAFRASCDSSVAMAPAEIADARRTELHRPGITNNAANASSMTPRRRRCVRRRASSFHDLDCPSISAPGKPNQQPESMSPHLITTSAFERLLLYT
ncbi:MAG: hypothetical protein Udaeo2_21380 [Candidatus Udaeobacter sp.]|nr:MAG: hypothetical protein Udaeo2_21380 [Candidatus Udaeobacter sp.]